MSDQSITELGENIIAIVNLKMNQFTFTNNKIEKVVCTMGGSVSKDDSSVFKG